MLLNLLGTLFRTMFGRPSIPTTSSGAALLSSSSPSSVSSFTSPALTPKRILAWGQKVSPEFRDTVFDGCTAIDLEPDLLMACMAFESGESFRPDIRNAAGSGATGLIQFMPDTAKGLGTSVEALAAMTAVAQLKWVFLYFKPYAGRLKTLSDVYMAILWPAAIGKPENSTLWDAGTRPTTYRQNAGLDVNKDQAITKAEAAAMVQTKLDKGRQAGYLWVQS